MYALPPPKVHSLDITNEKANPIKTILLLSWPVFCEQILTTLVSYADTAMVGQLGAQATASVSISNSAVFLINGVVMALGVGITALIARSFGARDYERAKSLIRHAVLLLLFVGLPLGVLTCVLYKQIPLWMGAGPDIIEQAARYNLITSLMRPFNMAIMVFGSVFRGRGDTKTPLKINIGINIINVVGNYLLINPFHTVTIGSLSFPMIGAGLGVAGAAISTGFSWVVGGTIMAVMLFKKKDPAQISIHDSFKPDRALIRQIVNLSVPAMLERFCMSGAGILVTRSIASLGTTVVAANSLYVTAESISFMPGFAFATAATTLVGQSLGAKKPKLAVRYTYITSAISAIILGIAGVCLYIFARQLIGIFTRDEAVIDLAAQCLRIVAFIQPVQVIAWVLAGALRGAGDTRWAFYITAGGNWAVRALGSVLCIWVFKLGLPAAVVCMCGDSVCRVVAMFLRIRSGKWLTVMRDAPSGK